MTHGKPGELKPEAIEKACKETGYTDPYIDETGSVNAYPPGSVISESLSQAYSQHLLEKHGDKIWDEEQE